MQWLSLQTRTIERREKTQWKSQLVPIRGCRAEQSITMCHASAHVLHADACGSQGQEVVWAPPRPPQAAAAGWNVWVGRMLPRTRSAPHSIALTSSSNAE